MLSLVGLVVVNVKFPVAFGFLGFLPRSGHDHRKT